MVLLSVRTRTGHHDTNYLQSAIELGYRLLGLGKQTIYVGARLHFLSFAFAVLTFAMVCIYKHF